MPKRLSREERDGINEARCCLCLPCPLCSSLPHFSILCHHTLAEHTNAASETQIRFFLIREVLPDISHSPPVSYIGEAGPLRARASQRREGRSPLPLWGGRDAGRGAAWEGQLHSHELLR